MLVLFVLWQKKQLERFSPRFIANIMINAPISHPLQHFTSCVYIKMRTGTFYNKLDTNQMPPLWADIEDDGIYYALIYYR